MMRKKKNFPPNIEDFTTILAARMMQFVAFTSPWIIKECVKSKNGGLMKPKQSPTWWHLTGRQGIPRLRGLLSLPTYQGHQ